MSFVDHEAREINVKIVYDGPVLAGKTTNLMYVHDRTSPTARSQQIDVASPTVRARHFSFVPPSLGQVGGYWTRIHLYTVPGPVPDRSLHPWSLLGVDGLVFVADSHAQRIDANLDALAGLAADLAAQDIELARVPMVMQWNKRDAAEALPIAELERQLNPRGLPSFPAIACQGDGVFDTLEAIAKLVLADLRGGTSDGD